MEILKSYEKKVLNLLLSEILSSVQLKELMRNAKLISYKYTGCGYFLTIAHPDLPKERIVCSKPTLIGEVDGIKSGFVIFIENNELTIECHDWGHEITVPEDFRDKNVQIKIATDMKKFVIKKGG